MKPEQGYKTQTLCTLLLGLSSMAGVFVLSLFSGNGVFQRQKSAVPNVLPTVQEPGPWARLL